MAWIVEYKHVILVFILCLKLLIGFLIGYRIGMKRAAEEVADDMFMRLIRYSKRIGLTQDDARIFIKDVIGIDKQDNNEL